MSTITINSNSAASELSSLISGLTPSNESTSNLVLILKTASIAGVDSTTIQNELMTRISLITTSTSIEEVALLTTALHLITQNRSIFVSTLSELDLLSVEPGTVVFVQSESIPYVYKTNSTWGELFPSLQDAKPLNNAWSWGLNGQGRLGDNTAINKSSPVSVVGDFPDWVQATAGTTHSVRLKANGTIWSVGSNANGRLGDGTTTNRSSPVAVVGGFTDWIQVNAGSHTLGIRANGTAWAWGTNTNGQLGDDTVVDKSSPVSVVGAYTDWIQLAAGTSHSIGIRANGTAWSWGINTSGRLGDGTTTDRSSPVSVVGGFTDWAYVAAGGDHSLGLRANGTLWAWGVNTNGRLGDGTTTPTSSPVSVVGGFTDWIQTVAGASHSVGLRANGTVWTWGLNLGGRLGDDTTTARSSPVSVVGGFTDWVYIGVGNAHTLAIRANGTLWSWGQNTNGQLGDDTVVDKSSPVSVVGGFTDWVQIAGGTGQSTGIRGG
jgi:alpha-tubulin suppressor-like RCC1 family protein